MGFCPWCDREIAFNDHDVVFIDGQEYHSRCGSQVE